MGMSTRIETIKPADDKWKQMKAVWDACEAAGVSPPKEVHDFFDGERPDPKGVTSTLRFNTYDVNDPKNHPAVSLYRPDDGNAEGFDVDLTKLPGDVKILRFYNSW